MAYQYTQWLVSRARAQAATGAFSRLWSYLGLRGPLRAPVGALCGPLRAIADPLRQAAPAAPPKARPKPLK